MQLFAALIPLVEFSDAHIMHKYEVKPDPETVDIITSAASQKEVAPLIGFISSGLVCVDNYTSVIDKLCGLIRLRCW